MTSRRLALLTLAAVATAATFLACDDGPGEPKAADALPSPSFGDATITGTVRFVGTPPELKMIDVGSTCREAKPIQEETIVVSRDGGLRDVVVWLADAPASNGAGQPSPTLDQKGCRYEPHVLAVQVGTPLTIRSSDPEFHNVHWLGENNPGANLGFNQPGQTKSVAFARPEFLRLRCDVHPWMESWVGVLTNPFFATTDRDGRFRIARVPAGTYQVKAWHALLGERAGSITVSANATAELNLDYARPKS